MSFITNITTTPVTGTYCDGAPCYVDNDGGNVRGGGTIADSDRMSSSNFGEGGDFTTVISGAGGATSAMHAGTFNQTAQYANIVRATTTIAGVSNNALLFGSSDSANEPSIKQLAVMRITEYKKAVVANKWNEYSGAWDSGYPVVSTSGAWNIDGSVDNAGTLKASGTDVAANPTSAVPGKLTYNIGNPVPTNDNYNPRYNW
jgi:hypothetical protein